MRRACAIAVLLVACQRGPVRDDFGINQASDTALHVSLAQSACAIATVERGVEIGFSSDGDATLQVELYRPNGTSAVIARRNVSAGETGVIVIPPGQLGVGENTVDVVAYALGKVSGTTQVRVTGVLAVPGAAATDDDGDCFTPEQGDCDDQSAAIHPGVSEVCNDKADNNCDGLLDAADPVCRSLCDDQDADGHPSFACGGDDCDDDDPNMNPDAVELCDGVDNNCDGKLDETYDGDGDGFISCGAGVAQTVTKRTDGRACPAGFTTCTDCDDADVTTFPGAFEPCDSVLHSCQGSLADKLKDDDDDGYKNCEDPDSDNDGICDPGAALVLLVTACVSPTAADGVCCDAAFDDNCKRERNYLQSDGDGDGVGDACDSCTDADHDGYGLGGTYGRNGPLAPVGAAALHPPGAPSADDNTYARDSCPGASAGIANRQDPDCNDVVAASGAAMYPANAEVCDGLDNDCSCFVAGAISRCVDTPFDADLDDYTTCTQATGKLSVNAGGGVGSAAPIARDDCDDLPAKCGANCKPGKAEVCDGLDNDCSCFVASPSLHCVDNGATVPEQFDRDNDDYTTCTQTTGRLSLSAGGADGAIGVAAGLSRNDCNDTSASATPRVALESGAMECDGLDNDCNGQIDDGGYDQDGDGYTTCGSRCPAGGIAGPSGALCGGTTLYGAANTYPVDCDDADTARFANNPEICDGKDNNCVNGPDELASFDQDSDGFTTCGSGRGCASPPCDGSTAGKTKSFGSASGLFVDLADGPGGCAGNCYPGHAELCDGYDNDYQGGTDEDFDLDGDGYTTCGSRNGPGGAFGPSGTYAADCDDDPATCGAACNPGLTVDGSTAATCDGYNNDCACTAGRCFDEDADQDADGYTTCGNVTGRLSTGAIAASGAWDCQDTGAGAAARNQGAVETCNGVDDDCDLSTDEGFDLDNDGYTTCGSRCPAGTTGPTGSLCPGAGAWGPSGSFLKDCKDCNTAGCVATNVSGAAVHPNQQEICDDIDNNCSGAIDESCDKDGDGYCDDDMVIRFNPAPMICTATTSPGLRDCAYCTAPNCVATGVTGRTVHPGATELCNGADDNCNGTYDEGFDGDNDTYTTCTRVRTNGLLGPTGTTGDCDDARSETYPGHVEVCFNGYDDDCSERKAGLTQDELDTKCCADVKRFKMRNAQGGADFTIEDFETYTPGFASAIPAIPNPLSASGIQTAPSGITSSAARGWESKRLHSHLNITSGPPGNQGMDGFSDSNECSSGSCFFDYCDANTWAIYNRTFVANLSLSLAGPTGPTNRAAGTFGNGGSNRTVPAGATCYKGSNASTSPANSPWLSDSGLVSPFVDFTSAPTGGTGAVVIGNPLANGDQILLQYRRFADHDPRGGPTIWPSYHQFCDKSADYSAPTASCPTTDGRNCPAANVSYSPFVTQTGTNERCNLCRDGEYLIMSAWGTVTQTTDNSAYPSVQPFFDWSFGSAERYRDSGNNWVYVEKDPSFSQCPLTAGVGEQQQWRWVYADLTKAYNDIRNNRGATARFMWLYGTGDNEIFDADGDDGMYIDDVSFFWCKAPP